MRERTFSVHGRPVTACCDTWNRPPRYHNQDAGQHPTPDTPPPTARAWNFGEIAVFPPAPAVIQTKALISAPGDRGEREADAVADRVMRMPAMRLPVFQVPSPLSGTDRGLQRQCAACEAEQAGSPHAGRETGGAPPLAFGPGVGLDRSVRSFMEPRFGHGFGQVRIHADRQAAQSAQSLGARAYTTGRHIVFGPGRYAPGTGEGRRLIAHELAHVLQQRNLSPGAAIQRQVDERTGPAAPPPARPDVAALSGVPYEKWSEQIESQYRARGDTERADAVRACRSQGGAACGRILTVSEVWRLYRLAQDSQGDQRRVAAGLGAIAPMLAPQPVVPGPAPLPPARPPLRLVPAPEPAPGPGISPGAAGAAVIVVILVSAGLELWAFGRFQQALRDQGFVVLEDPLALCIGGCHLPARPASPEFGPRVPLPTSPLTPDDIARIERFLRELPPQASEQPRQPPVATQQRPEPRADIGPGPEQRRSPDQTCSNAVLDQLQAEKDRICTAIPGPSCSPSRSPKMLARIPCSVLRTRIRAFRECLALRQRIQDECFGGRPDSAHQDVIDQLTRGMQSCIALLAVNCAPGHPMAKL